MASVTRPAPPDQAQRERALDPSRSILVQAPAGSGKTDLLTRRFLRLLATVNDPAEIVAITFTKAAAAEMRHRILSELEKAARNNAEPPTDEFSMEALAVEALRCSHAHGWNLLELPAQLRISTIDSFCRELALQQPLLSGLGDGLDVSPQPEDLYRRAARRTLQQIDGSHSKLTTAIEALLLWRDNNWQEMEEQLVKMLGQRDRWMHDFVLDREPDEQELRAWLEQPFTRAVAGTLAKLTRMLTRAPGACDEAMELARFACAQSGNTLHRELAELAEIPCGPFANPVELEEARSAYLCLAQLLLTASGDFRKTVNVKQGFPAEYKTEKQRLLSLIQDLERIPGLESTLAELRELPPAQYPEDDWQIVRACFTLLRQAAGELRVVFAEEGVVDFVEVAQVAQRVLEEDDRTPTDAAIAIADGIRHLLVDEFQDTSRRQHRLISSLVAAWPDTTDRTVFVVGDPMQSIYFFRDADAELFPRVQSAGLELPNNESLRFDFVPLASNFRTAPSLVEALNDTFDRVFAADDSGIRFAPAQPARSNAVPESSRFGLHLNFVPQRLPSVSSHLEAKHDGPLVPTPQPSALEAQSGQIVALIRRHLERAQQAHSQGMKYRIAVLGRTRSALAPIAAAMRDASIPFRAVDLEQLADRPEVLDVLALARALFNSEDRSAWLGVLRAPWCGLSLADLHQLVSADDTNLLRRPVPELLASRISLLSSEGQRATDRVVRAIEFGHNLRAQEPTTSLGTWLEQVWLSLGGAACVDATACTNLALVWNCLDHLSGGDADVLGRGLHIALQKLTAQPDPATSIDYGVQLMTIHKSKGLEFEVVIVPELQAKCASTRGRLLSWLERGIASPDDSGEITEFLVAPLQPKGADRGRANEWVDHVIRARETQEMRRILYVAATRAREELHLFARPAYRTDSTGELRLCEPSESLLSIAWPALEQDTRAQFETWKKSHRIETEVEAIAAAGDSSVLQMPSPGGPARLRRLPIDYAPPLTMSVAKHSQSTVGGSSGQRQYSRHEGRVESRMLGTAVHAYFEEFSRLLEDLNWDEARAAIRRIAPRIAAQIRGAGIGHAHAQKLATEALDMALHASLDPLAGWILSPHPEAKSELRWAGVIAGTLRTIQVDRIFRAGLTPRSEGLDAWWIVDYKTADAGDSPASLTQLRTLFAPQLELYAKVLRLMQGDTSSIRAGLYYPRSEQFDWWEL